MSQEFYSSCSSDDQSLGSINSVVHISPAPPAGGRGGGGESTEESGSGGDCSGAGCGDGGEEEGGGVGTDSERESGAGSVELELRDLHLHHMTDDTSTDSEEDSLMREEGCMDRDSDSSSSSEGTQVWVPIRPGSSHTPSKPGFRNSMTALRNSSCNNSPVVNMRNSMVCQQGGSGKVETSLIAEPVHNGGDSGISNNESPETHSSGEHVQDHYSHTNHNHVRMPSTDAHFAALTVVRGANDSMGSISPCHSPTSYTPGEREEMKAHFRESIFNILSGIYALMLVIIGAVLPVAEIFAPLHIGKNLFQGFYIYLFATSVVFLTYVYGFLLRRRTACRMGCSQREERGADGFLMSKPENHKVSEVADINHTGSFYLRLGAVGFGIGAMIYEGLMFGKLFEHEWRYPCVDIIEAIRPVVALAFTFIQLYFIFLNSKMCIHKYKILARFGLMHMIATNVCVWLRTVATETISDIQQHSSSYRGQGANSSTTNRTKVAPRTTTPLPTPTPLSYLVVDLDLPNGSNSGNLTMVLDSEGTVECIRKDIMGGVVERAAPYLYPCVIEYSLIAAAILYIMWRNIGLPSSRQPPGSPVIASKNKKYRVSVDCTGANRGLFFGIFTLVASIISMIVFFVLVEKPQYAASAVMVVHISEIVLYCMASIAVIIAAYKIRDLKFHFFKDNTLDETLLMIALTGQYIFCVFNMVAGGYSSATVGGTLVMITSMLKMTQSTIQTVFILNALRRSSKKPYHENRKPGREYITFLLVCNIAVWGINTFEVLRAESNPIALEFYGFLPWSIVSHVATPLAIFYRFHSTVCLASVWKNAYKCKMH